MQLQRYCTRTDTQTHRHRHVYHNTFHWRQPHRGCRGHIPQYFDWGDVNGNIPQYYYVLSDIADQYWLPSVRSASSRFHSAIRGHHSLQSGRRTVGSQGSSPNLELALTPLLLFSAPDRVAKCAYLCLCVRVSVRVQYLCNCTSNLHQIFAQVTMAVDRSSFGVVAICYVFPVL